MKKTIQIIVMAALCLNFSVKAQSHTNNIKPLKIGDTIPEELWNLPLQVVNHPDGKQIVTLNDYRGKLIILDFWATWCSPCVAMIPKMAAFQKQFGDNAQLLSVTYQTKTEVLSFWDKFEQQKGERYNLLSITHDKDLHKFSPHRVIPHYVWIGANGLVKSATSSYYVTPENIKNVLEDKVKAQLPLKIDVDVTMPLYLNSGYPPNMEYYSIFFKGQIDGVGSENRIRKTDKSLSIVWTNAPLIFMYSRLAERLIPNFTDKRLIIEDCDSSKLYFSKSVLPKKEWYREHMYSFDCIVPLRDSTNLSNIMLKNLNGYSGYTGGIEKRRVKYFTLYRNGSNSNFHAKGSKYEFVSSNESAVKMRSVPIEHLINWLDKMIPLVINNTGYYGKVDIDLRAKATDLKSLKNELQKQGLDLRERTGELDMFVIRERKQS